jgi:hypothetical protein
MNTQCSCDGTWEKEAMWTGRTEQYDSHKKSGIPTQTATKYTKLLTGFFEIWDYLAFSENSISYRSQENRLFFYGFACRLYCDRLQISQVEQLLTLKTSFPMQPMLMQMDNSTDNHFAIFELQCGHLHTND